MSRRSSQESGGRQIRQMIPRDIEEVYEFFNKARFPTLISRARISEITHMGGCFAMRNGEAGHELQACALVRTRRSVLSTLCVAPHCRGEGIGGDMVDWLTTNWVRALGDTVPFFERHNYVPVGPPQLGRKLLTQIMMRQGIALVATRLELLRRGPEDA